MDAVLTARPGTSGRQPREVERLRDCREELLARQHEASALVAALRVLVHDLESVLWSSPEPPLEAMSLTARIRGVADRYEARWETTS